MIPRTVHSHSIHAKNIINFIQVQLCTSLTYIQRIYIALCNHRGRNATENKNTHNTQILFIYTNESSNTKNRNELRFGVYFSD